MENIFVLFLDANEAKIERVQRNWNKKSKLLAKLTSVVWQFWGSKSRSQDFFKVVFALIRNCLGIVFHLKRPTLGYGKWQKKYHIVKRN